MKKINTIAIVGAGLAGTRTAESLRAFGYEGRLLLIGDEEAIPYERPSLSKELLTGKRSVENISLRSREYFRDHQIELMLGEHVETVSGLRHEITLQNGLTFGWDALVLATGARSRRLPDIVPKGVYYLRTLSDALALRKELRPGQRLAIVGAGFIGGEVASSALTLGVEVSIIETLSSPLLRQLGPEVGNILAERYREQGIDLHLNVGFSSFRLDSQDHVRALRLNDGSEIVCDAVLVGIGASPAGELLKGLGIDTDASGRSKYPDIYACGDVANAFRPSLGKQARIEHWTNASGQATIVAHTILGQEATYDDVPFFWSDQFGFRLQYVGHAESWERVEIVGSPSSFSASYLTKEGKLLAAFVANQPREVARLRHEILQTRTSENLKQPTTKTNLVLAL